MSISPNVPDARESYRYETAGTPRWIAVLFGVLFVLLAVGGFFGYTALERMEGSVAKANEQNKLLAAQLEQANNRLADVKAHVEVAEQKVGMTQSELAQTKSRAESIRKEQRAADERLTSQWKQSEEKIGAVASEVGGTKKDIEATKSDLETTKSRLERAIGDAGVMSGLIARNREDLDELRRRGERNIFEFTLTKSKTPQRVGPIQLSLQKADAKKQRYTMTVYSDDRVFEKRDKSADEPVQFYVKGGSAGRMLYEVVVFQVGKDRATGYLTTPKEAAAASTAKPTS